MAAPISSAETPRPLSEGEAEKQQSDVHVLGGETDVDDASSIGKQDGIKEVEAITAVWTKKMLWTTFALLWLVSFVVAMLSSVQGALTPYVTSSFSQHGLLAVISIASRIIGGVVVLAIGKIIDIRGRMEGFIGAIFLITIGMIMKATCKNVETYAAAQIFYWVGHVATGFIIDVFVADITTLRNRMIVITLNATPNIITTFAGPRIAELFYVNLNFRWAFGALTIVLIGVSIPVVAIMWVHERKAKKMGILRVKSGRTTWESFKYYVVQFDVLGMVLISAGWTLLLLPFSLVSSVGHSWGSATIVVMLVMGVVVLAAFVAWERFFAPVMFFPFKMITDRTLLGSALVYFVVFLSTFTWNAYYSSYLQVVNGLSITISNYVLNAYSLTSYFISPFIALSIRWYGKVKWPTMASVPIYLLATALIIYFRQPDASVGYLTMCQVLVGFSVGLLTTTSQLALMASVDRSNIAVAIAIWGLFGSIGSSIGYAVAGGIWTNMVPERLYEYLPAESKNLTMTIYGDIEEQMAYPFGSPIRDAVVHAYADAMRAMTIAGACLIPLLIGAVLMWRNIDVKKIQKEEKKDGRTIW